MRVQLLAAFMRHSDPLALLPAVIAVKVMDL